MRTADAGLADHVHDAGSLTPYGAEVRYPGDAPEPTQEEAREAVAMAERVHRAVLQHLPGEFRSSGG